MSTGSAASDRRSRRPRTSTRGRRRGAGRPGSRRLRRHAEVPPSGRALAKLAARSAYRDSPYESRTLKYRPAYLELAVRKAGASALERHPAERVSGAVGLGAPPAQAQRPSLAARLGALVIDALDRVGGDVCEFPARASGVGVQFETGKETTGLARVRLGQLAEAEAKRGATAAAGQRGSLDGQPGREPAWARVQQRGHRRRHRTPGAADGAGKNPRGPRPDLRPGASPP